MYFFIQYIYMGASTMKSNDISTVLVITYFLLVENNRERKRKRKQKYNISMKDINCP